MKHARKRNTNAIITHLLDNLNKNTDFQAAMTQSVKHGSAAQKVLCSRLGHSFLFDQYELLRAVNESEKSVEDYA